MTDLSAERLNVWFNAYRDATYFAALPKAYETVALSNDWKRYQFTFKVGKSAPTGLHFNATSPAKKGYVWVDAFQLEKGDKATDFETKFIEGELLTSEPDNFIAAGNPINACMEIHSLPNTQGTARVMV